MIKDLWRSRLAPFDEAYSAFVQASWDQVNAMSDADLDQVLLDVEQPSQTNVPWTMYRAAQMVRDHALTVREMRETGRLAPLRAQPGRSRVAEALDAALPSSITYEELDAATTAVAGPVPSARQET